MSKKGKLIIIYAPSGAGKTTLVNRLVDLFSDRYNVKRVITYTTRSPRKKEVNGVDYFFINKDKFENLIDKGFFLEWSDVYGNYYGTPKDILNIPSGEVRFLVLDRKGVKSIKNITNEPLFIWITPPSISELRNRLLARGEDDMRSIDTRIKLAASELRFENKFPLFDHHVINNCFNHTIRNLIALIEDYL